MVGRRAVNRTTPLALAPVRTRACRTDERWPARDAVRMFHPLDQKSVTTAGDARARLRRLQAERIDAAEAGLGHNALYMVALENDIAASRAVYVGLAVTEIATLRAQLGGPLVG